MPDTVLASGIPVVSKEDMVPAIREVQVTRGASKKKRKTATMKVVRKETYRYYETMCKCIMVGGYKVILGAKNHPASRSKEMVQKCGLK